MTAWRTSDGSAIACRDKLTVLDENAAELRQVMQDMFDDAIVMGVDETALRDFLRQMVTSLNSPKRGVEA